MRKVFLSLSHVQFEYFSKYMAVTKKNAFSKKLGFGFSRPDIEQLKLLSFNVTFHTAENVRRQSIALIAFYSLVDALRHTQCIFLAAAFVILLDSR